MSTAPSKSVLVGLDQSDGARAAMDWAAAEAALRGAQLLIATAWSGLENEGPEGEEYEPNIADPVHRAATQFLEDAAADMRKRHPGLDVDTALMGDEPVEGLMRLAEDAGLVVVGRRGMNSILRALMGSVSQQLVAHSPAPVAVVPESTAPIAERGPVVVGVARDVSEPLAFAFAEAETRGVPVLAVRAWTLSNPYIASNQEAVNGIEDEEERELRTLVDQMREPHPGVEVRTQVEFATAEAALINASEGASLIVVGRHRRHSRYGLPFGRVPHRVLHLSDLPVVVVPN
ncbi:universal stress protein [Streptacidiphilus neutrinimicus]|uniref:universal stress protein n=1 Tax=Streptacidiphilus neutrinimicus TaxID=105420 RepID=UPI000A06A01C|nr:universal stress protein [Streptacidiphilus neutrinimicus]